MKKNLIAYKSGYKYQLADTYQIQTHTTGYTISTRYMIMTPDGLLTIYQGYAWDGPSGPTVDTKNFMRGSLVHDAFYQLIREGHLPASERFMADKLLQYICLVDGMSKARAWWVFHGVDKFASSAASPRNKKKVHTAP